MESAICLRSRRADRGAWSAVVLLAGIALFSCERTPAPVRTADPAQQKLDAGLAPAYRSMKAEKWSEARGEVAAYLREAGARAHRGQAEFVIAMTYHRQQLYGEASEHFARAIAAEPGFLESWYYGGSAHFNLGELAQARTELAVYARQNAEDAATAFQQGLVELEDDRVDEAERFFQRAITLAERKRAGAQDTRSIDEDLGRYYARLGDVHVRRDDYARAKESFTKATALRADIPDTWHKLKIACERTDDAAGAARAQKVFDELTAARAGGARRPR